MAFNVSPEIFRKITQKVFFFDSSGFLPFVLFIPSDTFPQVIG